MTSKNPNIILRRIRSSATTLSRSNSAETSPPLHDLIQAFKELDNHLSWGGIPPDDWASAPFAASAIQARAAFGGPDPVEDIIRRM